MSVMLDVKDRDKERGGTQGQHKACMYFMFRSMHLLSASGLAFCDGCISKGHLTRRRRVCHGLVLSRRWLCTDVSLHMNDSQESLESQWSGVSTLYMVLSNLSHA